MSLPNLALTIRRIEDLPSDGGRTIDTLAGGMLRLFVRVEGLERRLKALEKTSRTTGNHSVIVRTAQSEQNT